MTYITAAEVLTATGLPTDYSVISAADINDHITKTEALVQKLLKVTFTSNITTGVTVTDEEYDGNGTDTFFIRNTPCNSITSLSATYDYGTSYTTITASKVWLFVQSGMVQLKPSAEVTYFDSVYPKSIKVTYKHGIVPDEGHKRLMLVVCAIQVLAEQIGGTFDDVTSYSLPEYQVSKGEPYTNIRDTILRLKEEYDRLIVDYIRPQPVVM